MYKMRYTNAITTFNLLPSTYRYIKCWNLFPSSDPTSRDPFDYVIFTITLHFIQCLKLRVNNNKYRSPQR